MPARGEALLNEKIPGSVPGIFFKLAAAYPVMVGTWPIYVVNFVNLPYCTPTHVPLATPSGACGRAKTRPAATGSKREPLFDKCACRKTLHFKGPRIVEFP